VYKLYDVKFSQDLTHQNHLNRLIFDSYLKNKKVDFFGTQCITSNEAVNTPYSNELQ